MRSLVNKSHEMGRNQPWSAKPPGTSLEKALDSVTNFANASRPDLVLSMTGKESVIMPESNVGQTHARHLDFITSPCPPQTAKLYACTNLCNIMSLYLGPRFGPLR